ncbi:hypothetical protein [Primorskyibacter sp. 2E233]|uniref:hypothetical protein n=1 Tax=Primorskyibacter sp. 2E233 TaxID=3413431 RepID=UPI003BF31D25
MITLHLGQPKTGTSVLQSALVLLSEQGDALTYPTAFRRPGKGHHALAQSVRGADSFAEAAPELRAVLEQAKGREVVFSSEEFANVIGPRHRAIFDRFTALCAEYDDVQGVLYLRRFDDFLNSMMLQTMRYGGFQGSPVEYVFQRLTGIYTFFAALRDLRKHGSMRLRLVPYTPGFDILQDFKDICPAATGLDQVGPLPKTEKFTWKQQVFIAASAQILGARLTRPQMERMIIRMREDAIQLDGDLVNYCAVPQDLDEAVIKSAFAAARDTGITEYTEAFDGGGTEGKTYVPFDRSVLTRQDIAVMSELAGVPAS